MKTTVHRDPLTGFWTIYQGGRHRIVCDGEWHHQINDDGTVVTWREKSRCEDWVGGCPARAQIKADPEVAR
jgi:hypothetical protein